MQKFNYHFTPPKGWMNDPNGLMYYKGKVHAFYQHYPDDTIWGPMHWGHAATEDFIHWEHLPIALCPSEPYDCLRGCWSGSGIEHDGKMYLFYTGDSAGTRQTQCLAIGDGATFEKYAGNPVIAESPVGANLNFRDPKVFAYGDSYRMVCGTEVDGVGKILLFSSDDLIHWTYTSTLFETTSHGGTPECPDLFQVENKWVLMFSAMKKTVESTVLMIGDFDGEHFAVEKTVHPIGGEDYYAPQTFLMPDGRRIVIGWHYHWGRKPAKEDIAAGAFTIPCEVTMKDDKLHFYPVEEARHLLTKTSEYVSREGLVITVIRKDGSCICFDLAQKDVDEICDVDILYDETSVEIFVNGGEVYLAQWLI